MRSAPHTWPRLYTQEKLSTGGIICLNPDQSHYLSSVLRSAAGDPIRLFNGQDGEWLSTIQDLPKSKKHGITLAITSSYRDQSAEPDLWLCAAPIKKQFFDFMIMKATELGVAVIQPVVTARAQVREVNIDRLRAIAIESAEQSERMTIPQINEAIALDKLIKEWPSNRVPLICAEFGDAQPIGNALTGSQKNNKAAAILTGPEGGFTQDEMKALRSLPQSVSLRLGPRILRADTAALAAISCWQSCCGDWQNIKEATHEGR